MYVYYHILWHMSRTIFWTARVAECASLPVPKSPAEAASLPVPRVASPPFCFRNREKTARPSQPSNRVPPNGRLPPASHTGASGTLLPASLRSAIPTLPRLAPLVCVRFQPLHQVERWTWLVLGPRNRYGRSGQVVGPATGLVFGTEGVYACEARPVQ